MERAGALAGDGKLVIACAYLPNDRGPGGAADILKDEACQIGAPTPTEEVLRTAKERAAKAGAVNVVLRPVKGPGRRSAATGHRCLGRPAGCGQQRTQLDRRTSAGFGSRRRRA